MSERVRGEEGTRRTKLVRFKIKSKRVAHRAMRLHEYMGNVYILCAMMGVLCLHRPFIYIGTVIICDALSHIYTAYMYMCWKKQNVVIWLHHYHYIYGVICHFVFQSL